MGDGLSFVVGCDVGTQSTKGVLLSEEGNVVATATSPHGVTFPAAGWAEQDPAQWRSAVTEVIGRLAGEAPGRVSHIAVDAQVDGVVATDNDLEPLHPAIIWMDRRAITQTEHIAHTVGPERVFSITGLNCDSTHGGPKMMWLLEHLDERPTSFLPPASFVSSWMTGEAVQDHANASSSMLYDVEQGGWSAPMLDATGIDVETLPRIAESTEIIGRVRPELAKELGLDEQTVVVVGTGDDHAAAVGAGAARPGVIADVTGTAEPIGVASSHPVFDHSQRLVETHAHAVPGSWFIENPGFVSGGSVMWLARVLGIGQDQVFELAASSPPGAKGLIFIPALSGSTTPRWIDRARASFTGASMDHGREDMCRAVLEGCTFALRDIVDRLASLGLQTAQLNVTGGGARSRLWSQMKADVTGRPVAPVEGESAALGAACLAAVAAEWFETVPDAADHVVRLGADVFAPDSTRRDAYDDAYDRYRATFDALVPTYVC